MINSFYSKGKAFKLTTKRIIAVFAAVCFVMLNVVLSPSVQALAKEKTIKKVIDPLYLDVYNKSTENDLVKLLPTTVPVILSDKTNGTAAVTWDTSKYEELVKSTKRFNLTGVVEGTKLKANIIVIVSDIYVAEIKTPEAITVPYGTTAEELNLPQYVSAIMSDNTEEKLLVDWDTTAYDGNVSEEKKYVLTGDVQYTSLTAAIEVTVEGLWSLVWSDEFDGTGSKLDTNGLDLAKWGYQDGTGAEYHMDGWGNNEQQYYSKDNIMVSNGNLVITPKMETRANKSYTSSRIWTKPNYGKKYGKFEARIKDPVGKGFWPAFWMMPKDDVYGGWAASGEIDIMEAKGQEPDQVHGTLHYGGMWPANKYSGDTYYFPEGTGIGDFHTYTLEWEPGEFRWYVDGKLYQTQNKWDSIGKDGDEKYAYPAPFDQEFYIILNLAIGGYYLGEVVPGAEEFANNPTMEVDYVRVYDLTGRPYKTPVEIDPPTIDLTKSKDPLPASGNLVYNGAFDKYTIDRLAYWNLDLADGATATMKVPEATRELNVDIVTGGNDASDVTVKQGGIQLVQNCEYSLTFKAKAAADKTAKVKLTSKDGATIFAEKEVNLTTTYNTFELSFAMENATDLYSNLEFMLGGNAADVILDDVKLIKTSIDYTGVDLYPLKNGDFSAGIDSWELFVLPNAAAATLTEDNGAAKVSVENPGFAEWNVQLMQGNMNITRGIEYTFSFKAKASVNRDTRVTIENADYKATFNDTVQLTSEWKNFTYTVKPTADDVVTLKYLLGKTAAGAVGDVYIDDVVFQVKNPPVQ